MVPLRAHTPTYRSLTRATRKSYRHSRGENRNGPPTAQNPLWSTHHKRSDSGFTPDFPIHGRLVPSNRSPYEISGLSRLQRRFSDRDIQIFMQIALQGWDPAKVAWFHSTSRTAVYLVKFRMLAPFRREVRSLQKGYDSGREKSAKDSPTA